MNRTHLLALAILCLTGIAAFALARNVDGTLISLAIGGITGLLGFTLGKKV